ncbi:MAG: collagen-like protein [Magnetococcales bacterium]|nr:collagen-like protein [Magnetococcales bacterium]
MTTDATYAPPLLSLPKPGADWPHGVHYVTIPTMEETRRLLGPTAADLRRERSRVFYQGIASRQRLPQGMHDRGEEFFFAAGRIHARDSAGQAKHFPIHVKVIRLGRHQLAAGEVWDLSVRHHQWPGLDHMEELYVLVHVDHLLLGREARVVVQGNVLAFTCGCLERVEPSPDEAPVTADRYDFGILPTPFSVDLPLSPHEGKDGSPGRSGRHGQDGRSAKVVGSLFGPRLTAGSQETVDGADGAPGEDGQPGQRGPNGGMSKLADLRFGRLVHFEHNPLRLFSRPGNGAPGGCGGAGGAGGRGGRGGDGAVVDPHPILPGRGGHGGQGGHGGDGGKGGSGGLASNIFVQVSAADRSRVWTLSQPGAGGPGGAGGPPGPGGQGGDGGRSVNSPRRGTGGTSGRTGRPGREGKVGNSRPGAQFFIQVPEDPTGFAPD